jgi:uncharacterized protein (DUF169 family)
LKEIKTPGQSEKMLMYARYSAILQQTLELEGSPVAVNILSAPPDEINQISYTTTVCMMLQVARAGRTFWAPGKRILCGARNHLGMGKNKIPYIEDFLVRQEKLFKSKVAARHLLGSLANSAPKLGNYLVFSPLEQTNIEPNTIVFIATPAQVSRILFLDAYETGEFDLVHQEPLCSGSIAIPMTSGKIGVSFLDIACRFLGKYRPEEMAIGVPYKKLARIINNIEHSAAGSAKQSSLIKIAGHFLRKHVPENTN